ncbi:hypothetical protein OFO12_07750 [Campylobacter sp. JMF_04 NA10]|uniref:hypothetical protein n=1 Tax=Campylobacter sp. JMF_04 NA10 TaxID=2983824 RepID=UPI0022E9E5FB|nr:hypothetical protein [Campylobacter sp. JMF_04 NA10]MDA3077249.1 hypothetical protein [Campylobacter sp. JMF_04 NA10]
MRVGKGEGSVSKTSVAVRGRSRSRFLASATHEAEQTSAPSPLQRISKFSLKFKK